ncbi:hypothetical protein HK098_008342, partial [Nowakowskiella sp. JEL0407]
MPGPHDIQPHLSKLVIQLLFKRLLIPTEIVSQIYIFLYDPSSSIAKIVRKWETRENPDGSMNIGSSIFQNLEIGKLHSNSLGFFGSDCALCKEDADFVKDANEGWNFYRFSEKKCSDVDRSMSVADILYYLRCLFPTINVNSKGPDGYKLVLSTGIQHKETGFGLGLYEWKGGLTISVDFGDCIERGKVEEDCEGKVDLFTKDVLELLNIFIPQDEVRFYHPAAVVRPTNPKNPYYSTFARYFVDRD